MKEKIAQMISRGPVVPDLVVQEQTCKSKGSIEDVSVSIELAVCKLWPYGSHERLPNETKMVKVITNKVKGHSDGISQYPRR